MYQHILVPIDGSPTSMLGLDEAVGLAADQNSKLHVLNVIDELIIVSVAEVADMFAADELIDSLTVSGKNALEEAAALAAKRDVRAECKQVRSRGKRVSEVILNEARRCRADLLVMGTHGRRGVNRLLMGSDAERVLREARVPVLLVRGEELDRERRKVLRAGKGEKARATVKRSRLRQTA